MHFSWPLFFLLFKSLYSCSLPQMSIMFSFIGEASFYDHNVTIKNFTGMHYHSYWNRNWLAWLVHILVWQHYKNSECTCTGHLFTLFPSLQLFAELLFIVHMYVCKFYLSHHYFIPSDSSVLCKRELASSSFTLKKDKNKKRKKRGGRDRGKEGEKDEAVKSQVKQYLCSLFL